MKVNMDKNLIVKMSVIGVVGILFIVIASIIVVNLLDGGKTKQTSNRTDTAVETPSTDNTASDNTEDIIDEVIEYERALVLIQNIEYSNKQMKVYDVEHEKEVLLNIDTPMKITNEYSEPIILDKLKRGYLVEVKYEKDTFKPDTIRISGRIWERKNLSTLRINEELQTIQIGSDIYEFNKELVALEGDDPLALKDVTVEDDIVIRGYKNMIWSILVESGHGYIRLVNYDSYIDGRMEIGNQRSYTIKKDMVQPASVGVHTVIITKDDMTPYKTKVFIEEDQEFIIDLSDLQPKVGKVEFTIVQEGVKLYIDDKLIENTKEQVELPFGEHKLRAKKEGFVDWVDVLVVNELYLSKTIDLEDEPMKLSVDAPVGADLYLDGVLKGTIPVEIPVQPGNHVIMLRKEGYYSWSERFIFEDQGKDLFYTFSDLREIPKEEPGESTNTNTATDSDADNGIDNTTDTTTDGSGGSTIPTINPPVNENTSNEETPVGGSNEDSGAGSVADDVYSG